MNERPHHARALLISYLRPHWRRAALLLALLLASTALQLTNPQIIRRFIDSSAAGAPTPALVRTGALFLLVALLAQAATLATVYLAELTGWSATNLLREDLARHCLRLDLPFHNRHTPGEMIERIDGDITALSNSFADIVVSVFGAALLLVGVLALLFREDWRVGAALSLFVALTLLTLNRARSAATPAIEAERAASAALFGFLEERLAGVDDIRANGGGAHVLRGFQRATGLLYRAGLRATIRANALWSLATLLFAVSYALTLGMGAALYRAGELTLGTVYLLFQYTQLVRRPLELFTEQMKNLQRAAAGIGRVGQLYALESALGEGGGKPLPAGPLSVELAHVRFGYGAAAPVLDDLSFRLAPGEVLGVIGRTGSGKTTLARLLLRLYEPEAGDIRIGGVRPADAALADLRQRVAVVTQEVQLFQASLRDNLTLFDTSIADARILAVLDSLELRAWHDALPDGLETTLAAGGGGLSAGEAQLLALARVFLRDPGLVIFDEASSRLDPTTERRIERAVARLLEQRTGILIAHRLGTLRRADTLLVLEEGRIAELGPREALAADPTSRYAALLRVGLEEALV